MKKYCVITAVVALMVSVAILNAQGGGRGGGGRGGAPAANVPAPTSPVSGNAAAGKALYSTYGCYACHGFNG